MIMEIINQHPAGSSIDGQPLPASIRGLVWLLSSLNKGLEGPTIDRTLEYTSQTHALSRRLISMILTW